MERLASLAPSATSTVVTLGGAERLVAVTAHDDADAPPLGGWLDPDLDALAALEPDLVLTADALQRDVRDAVVGRGFRSFHHEPATLGDVLDGLAELGATIGLAAAGRGLREAAVERLDRARSAVPDDPTDRPVVYCEEWPEPPMAAGNWVPEAVAAAGGRYPFAAPGERSAEVAPAAVQAADPSHVVVHHCGAGEGANPDNPERWGLDAAVHVVDDALLNQPSPRVVDGVELLAERLHGVRRPATPFARAPTP